MALALISLVFEMVAIAKARVLVQWVIRLDVVWCVEDEEDGRAVVDAQFEPPVGYLGICHIAQRVKFLLVLRKIVDGVVDFAELMNQVIGHLVEVAEGVHVVVASLTVLKHTVVARVGDWVHGSQHILS